MADGTVSRWKITFDPAGAATVLVDINDKIAGDVLFRASRGVEIIDLVDAADPFIRDQKNKYATISIQHFKDYATDSLARRSIMEGLMSVLSTSKKPLKVEISGVTDRYWQFGKCLIRDYKPDRYLDAATSRGLYGYEIVATNLTQVGP